MPIIISNFTLTAVSPGGLASDAACFAPYGKALADMLIREHAKTGRWAPVMLLVPNAALLCPNRVEEAGKPPRRCGTKLIQKELTPRLNIPLSGVGVIYLVAVCICTACAGHNALGHAKQRQVHFRVLGDFMVAGSQFDTSVFEDHLTEACRSAVVFEPSYCFRIKKRFAAVCSTLKARFKKALPADLSPVLFAQSLFTSCDEPRWFARTMAIFHLL